MKLSPTLFQEAPPAVGGGLCMYGPPTPEVSAWADYHKVELVPSGPFTNLKWTNPDIEAMFHSATPYEYVDGFSPNLNKHLHLGHLSNFVYAKAFQSLGIGKTFVALLGDTLHGATPHEEALQAYKNWCVKFNYVVSETYFASKLTSSTPLVDGAGYTKTSLEGELQDYTGSKGFLISGEYVVAVKSSGETSYLYHDVALAEKLNGPTLYLTGHEQAQHFAKLKTLFPHTHSVPLGLISLNGSKMSSSQGNVILLQDIWNELTTKFDSPALIWNVLAGLILKSTPQSAKNINIELLNNPKNSPGLYLSYTLAKLKSAGMVIPLNNKFHNPMLAWKKLVSQYQLNPATLLTALLKHTQAIAALYEDHYIKDHVENQKLFQPLAEDLLYGMTCLGLLNVDKV